MTRPVLTHYAKGTGRDLLLLNGIMMSMAGWDPVVAALEPMYGILRADFRGQLLSPGPPPATIRGHAEDIFRLLDELAIDSIHVAGTSFGGMVGLVLAAAHPDKVRSLTAITTTDRMTPESWAATIPLLQAAERAAAGGDPAAVFDAVMPATFSDSWRREQAEALARRRAVIAALPSSWFAGLVGLLRSVRDVDLRPVLSRIACPVLVIAGEADVTFPLEHSRAIAAAIPGAALTTVPGAPHGMIVERPEQTAALIHEFVASLENGWNRD